MLPEFSWPTLRWGIEDLRRVSITRRRVGSGHPVDRPLHAARLRTIRAAVIPRVRLDAVPHDLAVTVLALRCEPVDGAFEAVEDVSAATENDLESLVVVVL